MNKTSVSAALLLVAIWIILREEFSLLTFVAGLVIGVVCLYICHKYIPLSKQVNIRPIRLILFYFYLIIQVYVAGMAAIKLILTDARVEIVTIKTKIADKFLRVILVNSITLVPGSVSLELKDDMITVLWLRQRKAGVQEYGSPDELIKGKLERILIKAQK